MSGKSFKVEAPFNFLSTINFEGLNDPKPILGSVAHSSFNTLNEEHGTYGGGWGEIDESNLSIQLQHCNYTVVVHTAMIF